MRCITLANALRERGAECGFICRDNDGNTINIIQSQSFSVIVLRQQKLKKLVVDQSDESIVAHAQWLGIDWSTDAEQTIAAIGSIVYDWLIVDHYAIDYRWEEIIRRHVRRIMVIDDLADRRHDCDLLLDQNWFGDSTASRYKGLIPADCVALLGPAYALLRQEYAALRVLMPPRDGKVKRVLVFLGGSDPMNQTGKVMNALEQPDLAHLLVDVVIGVNHPDPGGMVRKAADRPGTHVYSGLPSLAGFMARADLMISAGGSTSWERMCLGLPAIVISIADNQTGTNLALHAAGHINFLGEGRGLDSDMIAHAIRDCLQVPERLKAMSQQSQALVSGTGTDRVCGYLLKRRSKDMTSRPVKAVETMLVRSWSEAVSGGHPFLPRQMVGGRELAEFFIQENQAESLAIHLLNAGNGHVEGAFVVARECTTGHDAQLGWLAPRDVTRHALRWMVLEGLDRAFSMSNVDRVTWDVVCNDDVSMSWFYNLRFTPEGRFRQLFSNGSSYFDVLRFALLRADWLAVRGELAAWYSEYDRKAGVAKLHTIQILTDSGSWIAPWVDKLVQAWESTGHTVQVTHDLDRALPADFCFCLSFSQIVPGAVRNRYKHTLVVHESDLPQGRGWAPMTWQILEGKTRIPVTLIEAVDAVDAGPIYLQEWIELSGTELSAEWRTAQGLATLRLCLQWVRTFPDVVRTARTQVGKGSVYRRRRPEDSRLDPNKTLADQFNLLRVVDNESYPAYFEMYGRRYWLKIDPQGLS